MIAIDSSVLIDLLGDDERALAAERCLQQVMAQGPVVVCDVVVSEVVCGLGFGAELLKTLWDSGIAFSAIEASAAVRAGEMQRIYKQRLKAQGLPVGIARTVPDFLIGAHALVQCKALITRDAGFYRDYFKGLKVIVPKAA